jgi:hypothetical protein
MFGVSCVAAAVASAVFIFTLLRRFTARVARSLET